MSAITSAELTATRNLIAAGFLMAEAFRRHAEIVDMDADARREGEETAREIEDAARKLARQLSERIEADKVEAGQEELPL